MRSSATCRDPYRLQNGKIVRGNLEEFRRISQPMYLVKSQNFSNIFLLPYAIMSAYSATICKRLLSLSCRYPRHGRALVLGSIRVNSCIEFLLAPFCASFHQRRTSVAIFFLCDLCGLL